MTPLARAELALDGLSLGDAFGELFFADTPTLLARFASRQLPAGPWRWTDDTEMALSIVDELAARGHIDQDRLAERFAARVNLQRGYGRGAYEMLARVKEGTPWRHAAASLFGGKGSFGNGAAMRAAPLGAFFAEDSEALRREATRASEVTHAHAEGIAGGVAVAFAAGLLVRTQGRALDGADFLRQVADATPAGYTREGLREAAGLPATTTVMEAAVTLGNGTGVTAPDTVPFALWSLSRHLDDLVAALWHTAMGLGDVDTTCAIVGGVGVCRVGRAGLPAWLGEREPLPPRQA